MGHDHHFLERLDRITYPEMEFALSLYRDAELVRIILARARVGDGVERVALSIGHPEQGPFVIVARSGAFVTCLGRGMSPAPWPVITRERVESLSSRVSTYREHASLAREWSEQEGGAHRLIRRIFVSGENLSREEFSALCAVRPFLERNLVEWFGNHVTWVASHTERVQRMCARSLAGDHRFMREYHDRWWAMAHLGLLIASDHEAVRGRATPDIQTQFVLSTATAMAQFGLLPMVARSAWIDNRFGTLVLPALKKEFAQAKTPWSAMQKGFGLSAIALGHNRLRAEVLKCLAPRPGRITSNTPDAAVINQIREYLTRRTSAMLDGTDDRCAELKDLAQNHWQHLTARLPAESSQRFASTGDIPIDRAMALALADPVSTAGGRGAAMLLGSLPVLARSGPEIFYLPKEVARVARVEWTPEATRRLLAPLSRAARQPVRSVPTPGRNEACSCGSARKFKRCCAIAA